MQLYKIGEEIRHVLDAVDPETGEMTDEQFAALDRLGVGFDRKAESVAYYIREQSAETDAIKAEVDRLMRRVRSGLNATRRMKEYLLAQLQAQDIQKIKGDILTIRRQNSAPSVDIESEGSIPSEYFTRPEPQINKTLIKDALKDGVSVPGACLVRNEHIRIG